MSNLGQQILSTEGEITNIATGAIALVNLFVKARQQFQAANPNTPTPEVWDDPVLVNAIATLNNDAAALAQHAEQVQQRQQAALDAESAGTK